MDVKDCMNRHVICISPQESVAVASRLMARHNVGALPVCERDGVLCGIITDRDVITRCVALNRPAEETAVSHIMSNRVAAVAPTDSMSYAAAKMAREQVRRLPVIEGRRLVGMVSLGDLSHRDDYAMEAAEALCEITANIKQL